MSKERELLKKVVVNHDSPYGWELMEEIQNLLAQPETKQEPVAWMYDLLERLLTSGIFESGHYEDWEQYIKELLAQPEQKREPLSEKQIEYYLARQSYQHFKWDDGFKAGVKWAEKVHGITGVDDE